MQTESHRRYHLIKVLPWQAFRFLVVGASTFALTWAVYLAGLMVMPYQPAWLLSFAVGLLFTAILNVGVVFDGRVSPRSVGIYGLYYGLYAAVTLGLATLAVDGLGGSPIWAVLGVNLVMLGPHFVASRLLVARLSPQTDQSSLSPQDLERLGQLQVTVLADSLVSRLGPRYAAAYWRFADADPGGFALLDRDSDGTILGAASVSFRPDRLLVTLVLRTPLLFALLPQLTRRWVWKTAIEMLRPAPSVLEPLPEVVMLMTDPTRRRLGSGRRLLLGVESRLRQRGINRYCVHTGPSQAEALAFYRAQGFRLENTSARPYCRLTKTIPPSY